MFSDCASVFCQDIPEDLHHVQRPQPSWQDDLVINEQTIVLTITLRIDIQSDQNNKVGHCSSMGSGWELVFPLCHLFQADEITAVGTMDGSNHYSSISKKHSSLCLKWQEDKWGVFVVNWMHDHKHIRQVSSVVIQLPPHSSHLVATVYFYL